MHTQSFEINRLSDEEMREMERAFSDTRAFSEERKLVELTESEVKDLETRKPFERKGWMRNQPYVCGSGKKFKRCCWSKFS